MSERPSPHAPALAFFRTAIGWSQTRLARFHGLGKEDISKYERGERTLTRETLDFLVEPAAPAEAVDLLLTAHSLIFPERLPEAPSPVALSEEEQREIEWAAMVVGCSKLRKAAAECRAKLTRRKRQEKTDAARQEAQGMGTRLKASNRKDRQDLVNVFPEVRSWALAEWVSHESERMAAHDVKEALELADLAVSIAERVPGEESWRSRVQGYCWAHVANARRVANDHAGADEAFVRAWELWRAGAKSDPEMLDEWRLLDLEASLRRDQRRFAESLELLDQAWATSGGNPFAAGRIMLKKEHVLNEIGDTRGALAALAEAAPFVEASGNARLLFALRFNMADDLVHLNETASR
jgi:transcriptional regulator with XRE-family HTH domain